MELLGYGRTVRLWYDGDIAIGLQDLAGHQDYCMAAKLHQDIRVTGAWLQYNNRVTMG